MQGLVTLPYKTPPDIKEALHPMKNDVQGLSKQLERQLCPHSRTSRNHFLTFGGTGEVAERWKVTFHGVLAKMVIKLSCF